MIWKRGFLMVLVGTVLFIFFLAGCANDNVQNRATEVSTVTTSTEKQKTTETNKHIETSTQHSTENKDLMDIIEQAIYEKLHGKQ